MTGEVLYRMYRRFSEARGCGMDKWEYLDAMDKSIWNDLAEWIATTGD